MSTLTWRDCAAPEAPATADYFTLDQILGRLERMMHCPTERNVRYWQAVGALPAPILIDGRAVYPLWYVNLIADLLIKRDQAWDLARIGRYTRAMAGVYSLLL